MDERLLQYIQQYRGVYTREAISRQLGEAGFSGEQIETAWQVVEGAAHPPIPGNPAASYPAGPAPASYYGAGGYQPGYDLYGRPLPLPRPRLRTSRAFWITFLGLVIGYPILLGLFYWLESSLIKGSIILSNLLIWGGAIGMVIGAITLKNRNYPVAMGLLYALVVLVVIPITLAFIALVVIFGICLFGGFKY